MNKTKRALISMIVASTVFCLALIFNMKLPIFSDKGGNIDSDDVVSTESNSLVEETQDETIKSFSYENEQTGAFRVEEGLPADELEEPVDVTTNSALATEADAAMQAISNENELAEDQEQSQANTNDPKNSDKLTQDTTAKEQSTPDDKVEQDTSNDTKDSATNAVETSTTGTGNDEEDTFSKKVKEVKYSNIGISVAKDYVNIRKDPSTDAPILGKLHRNSAATILEKKDDWYYVESGSVTGYVKSEFIKTGIPDEELVEAYGTLTATVDVDGLNVREETNIDSKKLTVIYKDERYPVVELKGDWISINIEDDDIVGNVMKEFVEIEVTFKEAVSKEEEQKLLQLQAEARAKKETEVKYGDGFSYTNADIMLLACLVHAEAGGQSYEGKLAVANVVLNRVKSSKYPDSIKAVIYQAGQFSVAKSGSLQKQLDKYSSYSSRSQLLSIKAAKEALEGANNIGTRLYFHTYRAAAKKGYTSKSSSVKLGDHLFW